MKFYHKENEDQERIRPIETCAACCAQQVPGWKTELLNGHVMRRWVEGLVTEGKSAPYRAGRIYWHLAREGERTPDEILP